MQDLQTEYTRALNSNSGAQLVEGFGRAMRTGELNNFQDGDVITFPELEVRNEGDKEVLYNKATGQKAVIKEPMMRNGNPTGNDLVYMLVEVNRNGEKAIARFFPSMFWKRRRVVKNIGTTEAPVWEQTDDYKQSEGEVVTFAQEYATCDQAVIALGQTGKGVKVTFVPVDTYAYGTTDHHADNVYQLEWA